jgi:hypothetical protein
VSEPPNAVFIISIPGYYRVEVEFHAIHFITRRGGEATVTTARRALAEAFIRPGHVSPQVIR